MFWASEQAGIHQSTTAVAYADGAVPQALGVGDVLGEGDGDGSVGPQAEAAASRRARPPRLPPPHRASDRPQARNASLPGPPRGSRGTRARRRSSARSRGRRAARAVSGGTSSGGDGARPGEAQRDDRRLTGREPHGAARPVEPRWTRPGRRALQGQVPERLARDGAAEDAHARRRAGEGADLGGGRPGRAPARTQGIRATSTSRSGCVAPASMTRLSSSWSAATTTSAPAAEVVLADGRRLDRQPAAGRALVPRPAATTQGRPRGWPSRGAPPGAGGARPRRRAGRGRGSRAAHRIHLTPGSSAHVWSSAPCSRRACRGRRPRGRLEVDLAEGRAAGRRPAGCRSWRCRRATSRSPDEVALEGA